MAEKNANDVPDRFAHGAGGADAGEPRPEDLKPGVTGGGTNALPGSGESSDASRADGTIGAVGEMDFTGAPAGTSGRGGVSGGSAAGESQGGGTGGGSVSGGGTGPGVSGAGPQSVESTTAFLGDREVSVPGSGAGLAGSAGGAGGTGGAGGSDVAGDSAVTKADRDRVASGGGQQD